LFIVAQLGMIMAQEFADPRARPRPHLGPERHEWIERSLREHAEFADLEAAILLECPEIEHVVADRDADTRDEAASGEHTVGEILDREVGRGIEGYEGAEFWVVGVGHKRFSNYKSSWPGLSRAALFSKQDGSPGQARRRRAK